MSRQIFIRPDSGERCTGYTVLRIDAVPDRIPPETAARILQYCEKGELSCELCCCGNGPDRNAGLLLILRSSGSDGQLLFNSIQQYAELIAGCLTAGGFRVGDAETADCDAVARFFRGELAARVSAACFWPEDRVYSNCYIPGSWKETRADLTPLLELLGTYPDSMVMCSFCRSRVSSASVGGKIENDIIRSHLEYLNTRRDPAAARGVSIYREKALLLSRLHFRLQLTAVGTGEFCTAAEVSMKSRGLCSARADSGFFFPTGSYFFDGPAHLLSQLGRIAEQRLGTPRRHPPLHYFRLTHLCSTEDVGSALTLPRSCSETGCLTVNTARPSRVPVPKELLNPEGVCLGHHKDSGKEIYLPMKELSTHGFFTGKTGTGKTNFALGLLYSMAEKGLPFLVIEPIKTEYRSLLSTQRFRNGGLDIWTPGSSDVSPMPLNIFLPPRGISLEEYKPVLKDLFRMGLSSTPFLSSILPDAIDYCYTLHGWQGSSTRESANARHFGMREFIRDFRTYVRYHVRNQESRDNVENSGIMRYMELIAGNPVMFDTNAAPDYDRMLQGHTIIELDALGSERMKSLVTAILLSSLSLVIRKSGNQDGKTRFVLLVDEAHVLLSPSMEDTDPEAPNPGRYNAALLQRMTMELRAYGTCIFYGDQQPRKLTKDIVGGVNTKLILRLEDREDLRLAADAARLTEQELAVLPTLPIGEGYFVTGSMTRPILLSLPNVEETLHITKDLPDSRVRSSRTALVPVPFTECSGCSSCDLTTRTMASFLAGSLSYRPEVREMLADSSRAGELVSLVNEGLPEQVDTMVRNDRMEVPNRDRLLACVRAQLVRALLTDANCTLTADELMGRAPLPAPEETPLSLGGFFGPN